MTTTQAGPPPAPNPPADLPTSPRFAHAVYKFAGLILVGWVVLVVVLSVFVPSLDIVGKQHTVSMSPKEAASMQAMMRVGKVFNEFESDSAVMIVLEGTRRSVTTPTTTTTRWSRSWRPTARTSSTSRTSGAIR